MRLLNPVYLELRRKMRNKDYRVAFEEAQLRDLFAVFIGKERRRKGFSQKRLASLCGMTQSRLSLLENAGYSCSMNTRTMIRVADALGMRIEVRLGKRQ